MIKKKRLQFSKITIVALFLLVSIGVSSQNRFGVFAGLNNSSISDGFFEKVNIDGNVSFHLGALYEYKLAEKIVFRPKLVFSLQGDREKTTNSFMDANDIDYKLTYLNIPLNFKFFNRPYIIAGPQIGFLLSTEKLSSDFGDVENDFDYGINLGTGYDFNSFFIELNVYQGFATLIQFDEVLGQSVAVDGKNTVIQLSVGYYFD